MNADSLHRGSPPAFNIPRVVIGLIAVLTAAHLIRLYGPFNHEQLIYYLAFIPVRLGGDPAVMEEAASWRDACGPHAFCC
jgi:hypothetical protein